MDWFVWRWLLSTTGINFKSVEIYSLWKTLFSPYFTIKPFQKNLDLYLFWTAGFLPLTLFCLSFSSFHPCLFFFLSSNTCVGPSFIFLLSWLFVLCVLLFFFLFFLLVPFFALLSVLSPSLCPHFLSLSYILSSLPSEFLFLFSQLLFSSFSFTLSFSFSFSHFFSFFIFQVFFFFSLPSLSFLSPTI